MMRLVSTAAAFLLFTALLTAPVWGEEQKPVVRAAKQGLKVADSVYLDIPKDMEIRQISSNVITPEPDHDYIARKIEEQNVRIAELERRLKITEEELAALKKKTAEKSAKHPFIF